MNAANLQLEGVYLVLSALIDAMVAKGVFREDEMIAILSEVERRIGSDKSRPTELRGPNVEAAQFPARFLKSALAGAAEGGNPSFAEVVSLIKEKRRPQDTSPVSP